MKKTLSLFVIMAMLFTGCSNKDNSVTPSQKDTKISADVIKAGITGTWVQEMLDGEPCPTNMKQVLVFTSATAGTVSLSAGDSLWLNHREMIDLTIGDGVMQWKIQETRTTQAVITCQVNKLTDNVLAISDVRQVMQDGKVVSEVKCVKEFRRDTSDYQTAIYGIWEGYVTSEKSEYDDGEMHRWEYRPDGNFVYYLQDDSGKWLISTNRYNNYFVTGPVLCTRWANSGEDTEQREWWEIESIENGVMKWKALRKNADGSTYTASFEMKKVPVPSMTEVAQNMLGKWIVAERNNTAVPTNEKAVITFNSLSAGQLSLSLSNKTWYHAQDVKVSLKDNLIVILNQKDEKNSVTMNFYVTNINQNEMETSFWRVEVKDGQTADGNTNHREGTTPADSLGVHSTDGHGAHSTDSLGVHQTGRSKGSAKSYVDRYVRIAVDYSQAILGVWEGSSTGSQGSQYDDGGMHRWEYLQDGTFRYYNKVDGQWVLNNDAYAEYFVDGILLCTRWKNNGDDQKEQREWWEIESIENGVMKWKALRKNDDGSTYTASFEMKKVE